jgi:hypothetical protein
MSGKLPEGKVVRAGAWGLLGQWFCVPVSLSEQEIVDQCVPGLAIPVTDPALIIDRFYGGFKCDHDDRRHVYFCAGQYTYLNPEMNTPLDAERRSEQWGHLLEANADCYLADGPFTKDAPAITAAVKP